MNTTNTSIDGAIEPQPTTLLSNPNAQEGLEELIQKLEPLLAGRRLNRIVDLMSVVADVVDMTDDYMVEKLCKVYEEAIGTAWTVGNIARMAGNDVRQMDEPPTAWELIKTSKDPDVRRGIAFMFMMAKGIGKQMNHPLPDDD
ncbi:Protein of unknown function [Oceanospirillum multiglobuliferum]|uniref:DUF1641 domain-containing protein n=1 Tax=Oceanospirillum multiglobuliferum TaxID=64969 RepID=A0A1T4M466_9GAMM|nr:DUF1641 domain-containing protein [Oceanospirillum multiglobuliferum]OPX56250.1 hypothetical protein BTE48_04550 [Oceanospirillum multiglobuliferum]SJZ61753.1 Protein of unknown function [Oceanospirillum multiglobuliferum]